MRLDERFTFFKKGNILLSVFYIIYVGTDAVYNMFKTGARRFYKYQRAYKLNMVFRAHNKYVFLGRTK